MNDKKETRKEPVDWHRWLLVVLIGVLIYLTISSFVGIIGMELSLRDPFAGKVFASTAKYKVDVAKDTVEHELDQLVAGLEEAKRIHEPYQRLISGPKAVIRPREGTYPITTLRERNNQRSPAISAALKQKSWVGGYSTGWKYYVFIGLNKKGEVMDFQYGLAYSESGF